MRTVTNIDARAFLNALEDNVRQLRGNIDKEAERLGNVVVDRARALVPVDDGETRESIHAEKRGPGEVDVHFGGASLFTEFGTINMPAEPAARPAIAEAGSQYKPPSY